jgi:hypothetical protein
MLYAIPIVGFAYVTYFTVVFTIKYIGYVTVRIRNHSGYDMIRCAFTRYYEGGGTDCCVRTAFKYYDNRND